MSLPPPNPKTLAAEKQELRDLLRQRRHQYHGTVDQTLMDQQLIAQWQTLSPALEIGEAPIIAGYYPCESELNLLGLMRYLENNGFLLALPTITERDTLEFRAWKFGAPLGRDHQDIPAPVHGIRLLPDIIFVPLLGFDALGNRLGQGKGHYDIALWQLSQEKKITLIGVGYACQALDKVPVCDQDYPLDFILTPENLG
jgi:5-formyltetrahydrofolate cyclo-ligase